MSTTTLDRIPSAERTAPAKGWARRFWDRFTAAREAQAERVVRAHLVRLDDKRLEALGFSTAEVEALRSGGPIPRGIAR